MEIKRDYYLNKLISSENNGLIKIITGIRRCGKSYLLDPIFCNYLIESGVAKDHIIKLDLDIRENIKYLDPDELNNYVKSKIIDDDKYYIILDEIQKVNDFVSVLNGFLKIKNVDIYVTGSNSKFLSSDIVTEFRGRGDDIKVYPFSFSEFSSVYGGNISKAWNDYYSYGGLPLILFQDSDEDKMNYLNYQTKNVYLNDVVERNHIQNEDELYKLVEIISSSIGSLTNPTKLVDTFNSKKIKIDNKTISSYLKYLEEAFFIEKSKRYDVKGKKYIDTPLKYYFTDIGIRNSLLNFRQVEETHIMENIIYMELRRRGFNIDIGVVEVRDNNSRKKLEIDFIANKGNNKYYIQSALSLPDDDKKNQEIRPLINTNDFFKKIVIVRDDIKRTRDDNGIVYMSVFDFLLDITSLDY